MAEHFLFLSNNDGLIKAAFFGEQPIHLTEAAIKEQLCQLVTAGCAVFAFKFADRKRFFIINYVLDKLVFFANPLPSLKGYPLTFFGLVDIWG